MQWVKIVSEDCFQIATLVLNWDKGSWVQIYHDENFLINFQFEFLIISRVINHMTCYNLTLSLVESTAFRLESRSFKGLSLKDKFSTRIITGHAIYNPSYTYKFQLKTTILCHSNCKCYRTKSSKNNAENICYVCKN